MSAIAQGIKPRYLLDTNIVIYLSKHRSPEMVRRLEKLLAGEAVISAITYGELCFGAARSVKPAATQKVVDQLAATFPVFAISTAAAREYGKLRAQLAAKGTPIGPNDLWIAAQAKSEGLTLVTNNEREFRRVSGLKVENWV